MWKIIIEPKYHLVCIVSLYRKTSVTRECVHIHTHTWRMGEFVSLQRIITQAASKRHSETWEWKCTRYWTRRSTNLGTWSWPQTCDWDVVVVIADIFDLFPPNLVLNDKLPHSPRYKIWREPVQCKPLWYIQTERQTIMMKAVDFYVVCTDVPKTLYTSKVIVFG